MIKRTSMEFNVGPNVYRLVVSSRRLFDESQQELEGLAHEGRRLLILSPAVDTERREEVALHELAHAISFHFPVPHNEEERCQLFATAARQLRLDMERQGGVKALRALPEVWVPHAATRQGPNRRPPLPRRRARFPFRPRQGANNE